jgi:colanic acid/amylovoran biosynthesis glycosyltransferase
MANKEQQIKIAFVVGIFPAVSETFIIDQVAALLDRGLKVTIFSFHRRRNDLKNISSAYQTYSMARIARYLEMPSNKMSRIIAAVPLVIKILLHKPAVLGRVFNVKKYGNAASSLRLLFWSTPFLGEDFDLIHAYGGIAADDLLVIKDILGLKQKIITTFLGRDVSSVIKSHGPQVYDRLKAESELFFVMSTNMRERLILYGFDPEKIIVQPVGIKPDEYQFQERDRHEGKTELISVGRFVEKKGFDDLLRALQIVKERLGSVFRCTIVGDGVMKDQIHTLADTLELKDVVEFKGFMSIQRITNLFSKMDFFVQPSKTAADGDME